MVLECSPKLKYLQSKFVKLMMIRYQFNILCLHGIYPILTIIIIIIIIQATLQLINLPIHPHLLLILNLLKIQIIPQIQIIIKIIILILPNLHLNHHLNHLTTLIISAFCVFIDDVNHVSANEVHMEQSKAY